MVKARVHKLLKPFLSGQAKRPSCEGSSASESFDAIILIGHDSRVPGATQSMEQVARALQASGRYVQVTVCKFSRRSSLFSETLAHLVQQGAKRVLVQPYFLNEGVHIKCDIPNMMQDIGKEHPDVQLVMGMPLGFDRLLVDLVAKRIDESTRLPDVRSLEVPDADSVTKE